tara:strand:- start:1180 stop:1392 length:213 start_codon:yes stop_codon:yes gene_type:complete
MIERRPKKGFSYLPCSTRKSKNDFIKIPHIVLDLPLYGQQIIVKPRTKKEMKILRENGYRYNHHRKGYTK